MHSNDMKNNSDNRCDPVNDERNGTKNEYTQVPKDPEMDWGQANGLENKKIRQAFIRKVYFILLIQLLITFGIVAVFQLTPKIRDNLHGPYGRTIYVSSYVVFLITYFTLACCNKAARRFPWNLILLAILTLSMSYLLGSITAYHKIESVLIALGITLLVCVGVTLFSIQTKYDFTSCTGVLFVLALVLLGFGIACIFTYSKIMHTIYSGVGALIFSLFLVYDTQMIVGGKKYELNAEDHIYGALMLYMDVVNIFLHLLGLTSKS